MSEGFFVLRIITPAGTVREEHVAAVGLPSVNGAMGVLPMHVGYTGLLSDGVVEYMPLEAKHPQKVVIGSGFCTFSESALVVLTDFIETAETVNREAYESQREEALRILRETSGYDPAWEEARGKLALIESIDCMLKK